MNTILFFDFFAATYLIFLGVGGFKRGFIVEAGKITGLIVTLWISFLYYIDFAEIIQQEFSFNPVVTLFFSFFIIFSLTFIITRIITALIDQIIGIRKNRFFNQLIGFVLGVFKGVILITMVLWVFELLPYQKWTDTLYKNSTLARTVRYIRDNSIDYFRLEQPISDGREHIQSLMAKDSTDQDVE